MVLDALSHGRVIAEEQLKTGSVDGRLVNSVTDSIH